MHIICTIFFFIDVPFVLIDLSVLYRIDLNPTICSCKEKMFDSISSTFTDSNQGSRLALWLGKQPEKSPEIPYFDSHQKRYISQTSPRFSTGRTPNSARNVSHCRYVPNFSDWLVKQNSFVNDKENQFYNTSTNTKTDEETMQPCPLISPIIRPSTPSITCMMESNSSRSYKTNFATILPTPNWTEEQLSKLEQQFQKYMKRPNEHQMQLMADSVGALYADIESWVRRRRMLIRKQKQRNQKIREHLQMYQ
ncbi:hypothetical protein SNEBB_009873 [Seison nebaliae]|nr:hypothetical protein SNEBB_009873 [Seison nebaliae]